MAQQFATGTNVPDAQQVAFIQGTGNSISQTISGLTPGQQYWFQVFYDARISTAAAGLTATYGTQNIATVASIAPSANYTFLNASFTPSTSSATLTITNSSPSGANDNSLLLDAISVIQRSAGQVVIANPSFEGSTNQTTVTNGYLAPAGWTALWNTGVNSAGGPFADNGSIPDGGNVAFLENAVSSAGQASLSQTLSGLTSGTTYQLKFYYNATSAGGIPSAMTVTLGAATLASDIAVHPVGGSNPYDVFTANYTATSNNPVTLTVLNATFYGAAGPGNNTLLVDNFSLAPVPEPAPLALLAACTSTIILLRRRMTCA